LAGISSDEHDEREDKKREIILHYNRTNGAVDNSEGLFPAFYLHVRHVLHHVMLRGHENDILPTFGNVRCLHLFAKESKEKEFELILLCLISRSAGGRKRRFCLTVPQYVIF